MELEATEGQDQPDRWRDCDLVVSLAPERALQQDFPRGLRLGRLRLQSDEWLKHKAGDFQRMQKEELEVQEVKDLVLSHQCRRETRLGGRERRT